LLVFGEEQGIQPVYDASIAFAREALAKGVLGAKIGRRRGWQGRFRRPRPYHS
jgi:hypothetical protein